MVLSASYLENIIRSNPEKAFGALLGHMKTVTANITIMAEKYSTRGTDHVLRLAREVASVFVRVQKKVGIEF